MTELQIKYANLLLDREKTEKELALNERNISEIERHNLATEAAAIEQNKIAWHQADSARMNADTNRLNYGVNYMNAETNRLNYGVNYMNAETNRLNYGVNAQNAATNALNAQTNARNAAVNERNAAINEANYQLARNMQQYKIQESIAAAAYSRQQAADLQAKQDAGYWESTTWANYHGRYASELLKTAGNTLAKGATAAAQWLGSQQAPVAMPPVPSSSSNSAIPLGPNSGVKSLPSGASTPVSSFGAMYMSDVFPLEQFATVPSPLEDFIHYSQTGEHIDTNQWRREHGGLYLIPDTYFTENGFGGKF